MHNLNIKDGVAPLMYVGEIQWQKLGTKFCSPSTVRPDTSTVLGGVSTEYTSIQNKDVLTLFDALAV